MRPHIAVEDLEPGSWWIAHDFPERPPDEWTVWDWVCDRCFMHMTAAARLVGDGGWSHEAVLDDGNRIGGLSLKESWVMADDYRRGVSSLTKVDFPT